MPEVNVIIVGEEEDIQYDVANMFAD